MENRIKEETADSPKSVLEEEVCFFFFLSLTHPFFFSEDTVLCFFSCSFTCPISTSVRVSGGFCGLSTSLFYRCNEDLFGTF